MNLKEYAQSGELEQMSFLWSEARLIIAAGLYLWSFIQLYQRWIASDKKLFG